MDSLISALDLSQRDDYAVFLTIHSSALPLLERRVAALCAGLPGLRVEDRIRMPALRQDLEALGQPPAPPAPAPLLEGRSQALGALYVLEGSRLGARLLADRVAASQDTAVRAATAYLDHGKGQRLWPGFLECADRHLKTGPEIADAVKGAETAFGAFLRACLRFLPPAGKERRAHV